MALGLGAPHYRDAAGEQRSASALKDVGRGDFSTMICLSLQIASWVPGRGMHVSPSPRARSRRGLPASPPRSSMIVVLRGFSASHNPRLTKSTNNALTSIAFQSARGGLATFRHWVTCCLHGSSGYNSTDAGTEQTTGIWFLEVAPAAIWRGTPPER